MIVICDLKKKLLILQEVDISTLPLTPVWAKLLVDSTTDALLVATTLHLHSLESISRRRESFECGD